MSEINENLRRELLEMRDEDLRVRAELAATGELFDGYCPKMEAVHLKNAKWLDEIIETEGFPVKSTVGTDGADAAWLIVLHSISLPEFQRRVLPLIEKAVRDGEMKPHHPAYLVDRIAFFENRPQRYGTQSDWNENGEMEIWKPEDEDRVNEYRADVGLEPLKSKIIYSDEYTNNAPKNWHERQKQGEEWARRVGWRK